MKYEISDIMIPWNGLVVRTHFLKLLIDISLDAFKTIAITLHICTFYPNQLVEDRNKCNTECEMEKI